MNTVLDYNHISVSLGDKQEFVKAILTALNLSPLEGRTTCIYVKPFWKNQTIDSDDFDEISLKSHDRETKIAKLVKIIFNAYQPVLKNKNSTGRNVWFWQEDFRKHFSTARERISSRDWLKQTLQRHNIDLQDTYEILN